MSRARGGVAVVLLLLLSRPAAAQWAQGAPGRVWVKSALFVQTTDQRYGRTGQREPWFAEGRSEAFALFTDIIVGVTRRLDLWFQIPYLDLQFTDASAVRRESGFGDVRVWMRYELTKLAGGRLPLAIRAGIKTPSGSSPLEGEIIPLGEGQLDLEVFAEAGYSFWPAPFYSVLWLGYRARFANDETKKDPGGEFVLLAEVGATPGNRFLAKATLDGFWGRGWIVERIEIPTRARRFLVLQLGGGIRVAGPVWAEAGVRLPFSGRNMPAGTQWVIGASAQVR